MWASVMTRSGKILLEQIRKSPHGGLNFKVDMVCDITVGLPCPDNSFDVVYSSHLIEDFIDTQKILKEFIRVALILVPGEI